MAVDRMNGYVTVGNTTEQVISTGPCVVYGIYPELTTTGTITLRDDNVADGGASKINCATGLTQVGKEVGTGARGVYFEKGLTVQLSVATDISMITWFPYP